MHQYDSFHRDANGNRFYNLVREKGAFKVGDKHPDDPFAVCKAIVPMSAFPRVSFLFDTLAWDDTKPDTVVENKS